MLRHGTMVFVVVLIVAGAESRGQTWTGLGADNLWSTAGNWTSPPPGLTPATLTFSGATQTSSVNNNAVTSVANIVFPNPTAGFSSGFTLSGENVTAGALNVSSTSADSAVITDTIDFNVQLTGNARFNNGSARNLIVNGLITQDGNNRNVLKAGQGGTLILTNTANSFNGQMQINVGVVSVPQIGTVGQPSPMGTGNPVRIGNGANTGTIIYTGSGETANRYLQVGGGALSTATGGATITANGSAALVFRSEGRVSAEGFAVGNFNNPQSDATAASRPLTLSGTSTADNQIASVIANNTATSLVGVTKAGSGRWILSGANTYTGGTQVNAGTLVLNGSTGVGAFTSQVASGATLAGTGTLSGPTTVSGILSPGGSPGAIGTLSFAASDFIWNSGASAASTTDWVFDLAAANQSDRVSVTGPFSKAGAGSGYRFDFGGSTEAGTFTLVDWTTTTTFLASDFSYTNLGAGNTGSFDIQGTSLVFTAVPEPATLAGFAVAAAAVAALARRRIR